MFVFFVRGYSYFTEGGDKYHAWLAARYDDYKSVLVASLSGESNIVRVSYRLCLGNASRPCSVANQLKLA